VSRKKLPPGLIREVNVRVSEVGWDILDEPLEFLCECGDESCTEHVPLTREEFAARISEGPILFPGHTV